MPLTSQQELKIHGKDYQDNLTLQKCLPLAWTKTKGGILIKVPREATMEDECLPEKNENKWESIPMLDMGKCSVV